MRETKQTKLPITWKHNSWVNEFSINQIKDINPKIIYDVGVGDGYWGELVDFLLSNIKVFGVELNLRWVKDSIMYYDDIIHDSIVNVIDNIEGDLIIFGDVLEHLEKSDMEYVLKSSTQNFKWVMINGPVGFQPQEHKDTEEIHRCGIVKDDLLKYNVIEYNQLDKLMMNCLMKGEK